MQELLTVDRDVLIWWGSRIEAALALGREGAMEGSRLEVAFARNRLREAALREGFAVLPAATDT